MTVNVIEGQSLFDIAIQELGSVQTVFDIAVANGLSVTTVLTPGQVISIPESGYKNTEVANYFGARKQKIATALTKEQLGYVQPPGGIGYMQIGSTFKVS